MWKLAVLIEISPDTPIKEIEWDERRERAWALYMQAALNDALEKRGQDELYHKIVKVHYVRETDV